jgi:hypothetical protein
MKKRLVLAVVLAIAAHWHSPSLAQSGALISNSDLSKESENPVSRQITLPLRYEGEFQDGATKATKSTFEIDQAVVPFRKAETVMNLVLEATGQQEVNRSRPHTQN